MSAPDLAPPACAKCGRQMRTAGDDFLILTETGQPVPHIACYECPGCGTLAVASAEELDVEAGDRVRVISMSR